YLRTCALTVSCPCGAGSSHVKPLINRPVAVIIHPVAELGRLRMDSDGAIITVGVGGDIPCRRCARLRSGCRVPVPIAVSITVEGGLYAFINHHDYRIRRCPTVAITDGERNR